jgi:ACS family allantoate permease-like MFS transporter
MSSVDICTDLKNQGTKVSIHSTVSPVLLEEDFKDKDIAAKFLLENEGKFNPMTDNELKKMIRKTDWVLLPILFFTATMGAVDKVALGTSAIFGLREDNHLVGQQYSWLSTILFIGSLVGMWPMSYLIQRWRLGKVMGICSLTWSALTLLLCACHNFAGLAAIRFLMGFVECAIVPGCSLIISIFYVKDEIPHRTAIIFMFMSSVINGALSALASTFGDAIPTWKYIFILIGCVSTVWSIFVIFYLPDSPMNARFLTAKEKYYTVKRVSDNKTGVENNEWKWCQVKEAFLDPRIYIVMLFNFGINIPNGGLSTYSSIIINNLGFSSVKSSLMGIPTGVIASIATVFFTWWAARWENRRCLLAIISLIIPLIGAIILYTVDQKNTAAQLVGLYFMYFYFASYVVIISCVQANTAGNTKKSITYGFNYLGYCGGAITGTQTFRSNQAPKYTGGFISMLVGYCACILLCAIYWFVCIVMNKKKRSYLETIGDDKEAGLNQSNDRDLLIEEELADLTDKEQIHFFYTT